MRTFYALLTCLATICLTASGCEPSIQQEDLGTIVSDVSKVPGTEKPYEIPFPEEKGKEATEKKVTKEADKKLPAQKSVSPEKAGSTQTTSDTK